MNYLDQKIVYFVLFVESLRNQSIHEGILIVDDGEWKGCGLKRKKKE